MLFLVSGDPLSLTAALVFLTLWTMVCLAHETSNRTSLTLLIVLVVGCAVRLAFLPWTADLGTRIFDEQHYHVLASSVADGHGFATASGPTSLRPPLYPAFVAAVWSVTGTRSLQAVRVAQFALATMLSLTVFAIGRDLFGERAGTFAAAITALYPALFVSNYLLLTEVLFAALLALAVWAAVRMFRSASVSWAAATGALLALSALTRSVVYPLPPVLALLALVALPVPWRRRVAVAAALAGAAALVLAPWAVRNTRLQHVPVLVDTMGGMNLRMGNYEFTPLDRMWDAVSLQGDQSWIRGYPAEGLTWTEGQKERWARGQAVGFMVQHPGLTAWRAAVKFGDFWALDRDFAAGVQRGLYRPPIAAAVVLVGTLLLAYPAVLFLSIAGLRRLSTANWPVAWLPLVVVLFVCALHTIVFGHPRYRLPLMPLVAVYTGAALDSAVASSRARLPRPRLLPVAAAAFVTLWIAQFVWRDWSMVERLMTASGVWS